MKIGIIDADLVGRSISNRAFFADLKRLLAGKATIEEIL